MVLTYFCIIFVRLFAKKPHKLLKGFKQIQSERIAQNQNKHDSLNIEFCMN